jgi:predicted PurR-regulated permease PerM
MPGVASSALGAGGDLVVILATALFLAASPALYVGGVLRLLPPGWRPRGHIVLDGLTTTLRLWFLGQFADMVVVAVLTGTGLFLLGVPLAMTLALIAGLFNFVPYIGALAGAVPALAVAVAHSPQTALYVAILFGVVQTLEGNVIAPLIQKRTVDLPPALTILSQTVLGTLFGIMGLILATPLTAATVVAVRMIYVETVLEGTAPPDAGTPAS